MIFDTDVFIWIQRGNRRAAQLVQNAPTRFLSIQTYMELLQGARNRAEQVAVRRFLSDFGFVTLPLTPEIGNRAAGLVESLSLSHGMRAGDALIAATAIESGQVLCTANVKHFRQIPMLELQALKIES